nr:HAMP domain-containing sensor histidine kinase [Aquisediminimonas sediminicola]
MVAAAAPAAHVGNLVEAVDDGEQLQRLRELVHELRTPLNAISGFADMIRSQFFGPVPHQYREQAETIIASGAELTQILEDLALLVRGPVHRFGQTAVLDREDEAGVDGGEVLRRVLAAHQGQADARQLTLQVEIGRGLPPLAVGEQVLERVLSRLIGNLIELCHHGENVSIDFLCLPRTDGSGCVSISRPGKLLGIAAEELFDPDRAQGERGEQSMDAARLSLGFTLHLLRNVARQFGGDLDIADHDFLLLIPAVMSEHQIRFP